jgi:putative polyketide hydroxylase
MAGQDGDGWREPAERIIDADRFNFQCYQIGSDLQDIENRWSSYYGVNASGAALVRPDGFIAWRAKDAMEQPETVLRDVLERLSFRIPAGGEWKFPVSRNNIAGS